MTDADTPFLDTAHDHAHCRDRAVDQASEICAKRGVRLTPLRRRVLELVWNGHKPVGAYELLDMLKDERGVAAPPTVYRALDFLVAHGLVHRIESLNAFVGCSEPNIPHGAQFLICRSCGTAAELNDPRIDEAINECAAAAGFQTDHRTIEVEGLCPNCK